MGWVMRGMRHPNAGLVLCEEVTGMGWDHGEAGGSTGMVWVWRGSRSRWYPWGRWPRSRAAERNGAPGSGGRGGVAVGEDPSSESTTDTFFYPTATRRGRGTREEPLIAKKNAAGWTNWTHSPPPPSTHTTHTIIKHRKPSRQRKLRRYKIDNKISSLGCVTRLPGSV